MDDLGLVIGWTLVACSTIAIVLLVLMMWIKPRTGL